jgi:uncharacterized membrane protein required for colicin V production
MINNILSVVNVVDVLMVLILLRAAYIGFQQGILVELFKIIGILLANLIAIHYFSLFAQLMRSFLPFPPDMLQIIAFVSLWVFVVFMLSVVRSGWLMGFAPREKKSFEKFSGAGLGFIRGTVVCSLTFMLIFVSGQGYLIQSARRSLSGFYLAELSPRLYNQLFDYGVAKILPNEVKNEKALEFITDESKSAQ